MRGRISFGLRAVAAGQEVEVLRPLQSGGAIRIKRQQVDSLPARQRDRRRHRPLLSIPSREVIQVKGIAFYIVARGKVIER